MQLNKYLSEFISGLSYKEYIFQDQRSSIIQSVSMSLCLAVCQAISVHRFINQLLFIIILVILKYHFYSRNYLRTSKPKMGLYSLEKSLVLLLQKNMGMLDMEYIHNLHVYICQYIGLLQSVQIVQLHNILGYSLCFRVQLPRKVLIYIYILHVVRVEPYYFWVYFFDLNLCTLCLPL